ncbi:hypothetical protein L1887_43465 [Cichorium endivia]|nr:hypothetical protein L1887_43465 [Cichorium endivia]
MRSAWAPEVASRQWFAQRPEGIHGVPRRAVTDQQGSEESQKVHSIAARKSPTTSQLWQPKIALGCVTFLGGRCSTCDGLGFVLRFTLACPHDSRCSGPQAQVSRAVAAFEVSRGRIPVTRPLGLAAAAGLTHKPLGPPRSILLSAHQHLPAHIQLCASSTPCRQITTLDSFIDTMASYVANKVTKRFVSGQAKRYEPEDPLYEFYTGNDGKQKRRKRALPPGLTRKQAKLLKKIKKRAHYLDKGFYVCGLRFGWTFFIGLVPGLGRHYGCDPQLHARGEAGATRAGRGARLAGEADAVQQCRLGGHWSGASGGRCGTGGLEGQLEERQAARGAAAREGGGEHRQRTA